MQQNATLLILARSESLKDTTNLPDPDVLAAEIVEDLRAALAQFQGIEDNVNGR